MFTIMYFWGLKMIMDDYLTLKMPVGYLNMPLGHLKAPQMSAHPSYSMVDNISLLISIQ